MMQQANNPFESEGLHNLSDNVNMRDYEKQITREGKSNP